MSTKRKPVSVRSGAILSLLEPVLAKYDVIIVEKHFRRNQRHKVLDLLLVRFNRKDLLQPPDNRRSPFTVESDVLDYAHSKYDADDYVIKVKVEHVHKAEPLPVPFYQTVRDALKQDLDKLPPPFTSWQLLKPSPSAYTRYVYAGAMLRLQVRYGEPLSLVAQPMLEKQK